MATSSPEPPAPFVCSLCPQQRPAAWCRGCPRETNHHFVGGQLPVRPTDLVIVLDAPPQPKVTEITKLHTPMQDDAGRVALAGLKQVIGENVAYSSLSTAATYVVLCTEEDPKKEVITRCSQFLTGAIKAIALTSGRAPVVVACGLTAAKALGVKATKLKDIQGRFFHQHEIDGVSVPLLCTISGKMISTMAGVYNVFLADVRRAVMYADERRRPQGVTTPLTLEELTKDYRYPQTVDEVAQVCNEIIEYSEKSTNADDWFIFFDTETNTKYPHRKHLKLLMVSFAWAKGKAVAIPLYHAETPYDPDAAMVHVKRVLACPKPKGAHNLKFDLKVLRRLGYHVENPKWCSMMGEHLLEEDKKGQYGLKLITKIVAPQFADYADAVQEAMDKQDGSSQLDDIRKRRKKTEAEKQAALEAKKVSKKKKALAEDVGFAEIKLIDLARYGAIDSDMGRRITLNQLDRMAAEQESYDAKRRMMQRDNLRRYPIPSRCAIPSPLRHMGMTHVPALMSTLADMELHGVPVDREHLEKLDAELEVRIAETGEKLHRMIGNSDAGLTDARSIARILFADGFIHPETGAKVIYDPITWTKHGQAQTTEKVLQWFTLNRQCPFCVDLLVHKKLCKARNPFVGNVRDLSEEDGRLHSNYNGHGTCTSRLSCVAGDTLLNTTAGTIKIRDLDLQKTPNIAILTHALREQPILAKIDKGIDEMFRVELENGATIECTADHKFLTAHGWVRLGDLKEEDEVLCAEEV